MTVQVGSIGAKAEETKSTKTHFGKKLPKHVTKDCHGPYDVTEVKDGTVEEKEVTPAPDQYSAKSRYSLKVKKPIKIKDTTQVIKDANDIIRRCWKAKRLPIPDRDR